MSSGPIPNRGPPGPPRPQVDKQSNGKLDGNITKVATMLWRLQPMNAQRISLQELRDKFGIIPQLLDVQTGKPLTHGETFIKLVSSDQMSAWMDHFQPRQEPDFEESDFEFEDLNPRGPSSWDPAGESIDMKNKILNHVLCSKNWEMGNIVESKTSWRSFLIKWDHLQRSDHHHNWEVSEIFLSVDPSQRDPMCLSCDPDPRFPHIQAWLHDAIPVGEDLSLTVAELSTVLALALSVMGRPMYRRALIAPITVFSCSSRRLRIVQGGVDFQSGKVDIRISPTADFSAGGVRTDAQSRAILLNVLGWFCGEPVGKVMP